MQKKTLPKIISWNEKWDSIEIEIQLSIQIEIPSYYEYFNPQKQIESDL